MSRKRAFLLTIAISLSAVVSTCMWDPGGIYEKAGCVFAGDILDSGKKLYSQYDEELIIRDFFNDRRGGVFVDVGCYHYKDISTTYYLEKHLG